MNSDITGEFTCECQGEICEPALYRDSIFEGLGRKLRQSFVQEVPPELDACELCREPYCSQARWEACPKRHAKLKEITGSSH